jgi:hypothetical protein
MVRLKAWHIKKKQDRGPAFLFPAVGLVQGLKANAIGRS